ncbi:nicotinate-nucleotide adenylyltransferase [Chitinasiproducens palmae]|uniref:nicotinate-nucleotide adenylyltransferase n=1 Tax=Chitinasiproducens palmae TaxID=1770053 RepID=UPI0038B3B7BF
MLGGTFDPIHAGHLAIARHFAALLHLDTLVLMPAGQPWQKRGVSAAAHRLAMTRLAAAELDLGPTRVVVADDEIQREGATYTVETMTDWRTRLGPAASLSLIIGADQLQGFATWRGWQDLLHLGHLCVAARPGFAPHSPDPALRAEIVRRRHAADWLEQHPAGGILIDEQLKVELSATDIRHRIQAGIAAADAHCDGVPRPVWHYIRQHHLYHT